MKLKQENQNTDKIVLVGGCFDFIHFGHVNFLKSAKKLGGKLVVALESDVNVRKTKGHTRPVHTQDQRRQMLEAISFIDKILMLPPMRSDDDYFNLVLKIKPAVIATTAGDPVLEKKRKQAKKVGAKLVIIPKIHTPSTSQLAKLLGLE